MPKIKVLSRNPDDYVRETKHDIHKMPRNYAPDVHPMAQAREYVRALNATKLERVFAKPFIASLDGHTGKRDARTHALMFVFRRRASSAHTSASSAASRVGIIRW